MSVELDEWDARDDPALADHEPDENDEPAKDARPSQSTALVRQAEGSYRVALDLDGTPFAVELGGPNIAIPFRGAGGLGRRLSALYYAMTETVPNAGSIANALAVLEGIASRAPREAVAQRVARDGGAIVLDLGTADGAAVVVDSGGWAVITRSPVLFRRTALTGAHPMPTRGGSLDGLRDLLHVDDEAWALMVGWLVAGLFADIAHPVLRLGGPQGSGKSSAARLLSEVLDPSPAPLRSAPRDLTDWAVSASGSWVVALDNLSTISPSLSDALCRAVTGDGLVRRALYTDAHISVLAFRRVVILTAIDAGALRGDLADRLLPIELEGIAPTARLEDEVLAERWAGMRARVLGGLLDLASETLRELPRVRPASLPRLADCGRVLAAVDAVRGTSSFESFARLGGRIAEEVVDGDDVALAVRALVQEVGAWSGTTGDLLGVLDERRGTDRVPGDWPRNAHGLAGRLKRCAAALKATGVSIEHTRQPGGSRQRIVHLERKEGESQRSRMSRTSREALDVDCCAGDARDVCDPAIVSNVPIVPPNVPNPQATDRDVCTFRDDRDVRDVRNLPPTHDGDGADDDLWPCISCGRETVRRDDDGRAWCLVCQADRL